MGYAAEYLIPSLSDVLATIALPHSVTYLLRGVNGETLNLNFQNSPITTPCPITRYVTYSNMCRTPHPPAVVKFQGAPLPLDMIGITFDVFISQLPPSTIRAFFSLISTPHHFVFFTLEASVPPSIRNHPRSIIHIQTIHKHIQASPVHGYNV